MKIYLKKKKKEEKESIKGKLSTLGLLVFAFNRKQFDKVITQSLGIEHFNYENWQNSFLNAWTNRNVNLIKGLTEEYRKKIMDTIIDNYQKGVRLEELKDNLRKINKTFSETRINLIAKDQISKINGQLAMQRQKDAGIDTYWWRDSRDERVRGNPSGKYPKAKPSHWVMNGKLCRWDDPTVYSDDMGKTWKSRASIGGVELHPQQDYQCRCFAEPNFEPLVNEVNRTQEDILG
jgi:SPP1 gp7 family putative phage head morphogenesis protein